MTAGRTFRRERNTLSIISIYELSRDDRPRERSAVCVSAVRALRACVVLRPLPLSTPVSIGADFRYNVQSRSRRAQFIPFGLRDPERISTL